MEPVRDVLAVLYFFVPAYVANMAPVLAKGHLDWMATPMDLGRTFHGRRVLGDHKTWRGLVAGVLGGVAAFALQRVAYDAGWLRSLALIDYAHESLWLGVLLGAGTIAGDAAKSFVKRQIGIRPGASWFGFDQLDFLVGAYLFAAPTYAPSILPTLAILPIVLVGGVLTTAVGFRLGLKESWV